MKLRMPPVIVVAAGLSHKFPQVSSRNLFLYIKIVELFIKSQDTEAVAESIKKGRILKASHTGEVAVFLSFPSILQIGANVSFQPALMRAIVTLKNQLFSFNQLVLI